MRFLPRMVHPPTGPAVFAFAVSLFASSAVCDTARASGPVERLIQVLAQPAQPDYVVVRYGVASEGFLLSRDGGRSFKALCSQAITPTADERDKLRRISSQRVPSAAATLIDADGKLLVAQLGGLWSDDGTGCSWSKDPALEGKWAYSLKLDPKTAELLAVVNVSTGDGDQTEAQSKLMRRGADGRWSTAGNLKQHVATQRAYGGDLLVSATESGTRMYASVSVARGALASVETWHVVASDDGGQTWSEGSPLPSEQQDGLTLLAIDPLSPDRLLAVTSRDSAADTLLLSEDQGKTFRVYAQDVRETTGVAFAPDGRVFVADAGDSSGEAAEGGVWTAARLGQPLTKIAGTKAIDCIGYAASSDKLQVCSVDKFGFMDPLDGTFEQTSSITSIESLLECPNLDVGAACETQLNAGPSWCCTGHYPFTPFCGEYDVTMVGGRRQYCGLSGRAYDQMAGRGPVDAGVDAGRAPDAGAGGPAGALDAGRTPVPTDEPSGSKRDAGTLAPGSGPGRSSGGDGCAVSSDARQAGHAGLVSFVFGALALLARGTRRGTRRAPGSRLARAQARSRSRR
jgi:hypothetical protein